MPERVRQVDGGQRCNRDDGRADAKGDDVAGSCDMVGVLQRHLQRRVLASYARTPAR